MVINTTIQIDMMDVQSIISIYLRSRGLTALHIFPREDEKGHIVGYEIMCKKEEEIQ